MGPVSPGGLDAFLIRGPLRREGSRTEQSCPTPYGCSRGMLGVMDTKMIKTIGEHWVCATLARHGWAQLSRETGWSVRTSLLSTPTCMTGRWSRYRSKPPPREVRQLSGFWAPKRRSWLNQRMSGSPSCSYRSSLPPQGPSWFHVIIYRRQHGLSIRTGSPNHLFRREPGMQVWIKHAFTGRSGSVTKTNGICSACQRRMYLYCCRRTCASWPSMSVLVYHRTIHGVRISGMVGHALR